MIKGIQEMHELQMVCDPAYAKMNPRAYRAVIEILIRRHAIDN